MSIIHVNLFCIYYTSQCQAIINLLAHNAKSNSRLSNRHIEQEMKQAVSAHVKYGMMGRHNHLKDINIDFFSYKGRLFEIHEDGARSSVSS